MTERLREPDRKFFALISEAAFANPFGAQRSQLDAVITEAPSDDPAWNERMLTKLDGRLRALGKLELSRYGDSDRELIENALLFEAFHRFLQPFDDLIERQTAARETPARADFADDFLRWLHARDFGSERAERMLELFYQMRRAYKFIAQGLTGKSRCMSELREALWCAVFTRDIRSYERHLWNRMEDFSTLVVGETGTGKGAAAAAIGLSGYIAFDAKKKAFAHGFHDSFVPIHLNEFPETLFESEIFGHKKGAFTGATDNHEGALSRCTPHGTVFFDEIGEATLPVQVKLLRVLQERVYTPVGSREPRRFHGRIVAATHRSLSELRASGAMRDDFFYRLCSNVIEVPPLRARIAQAPDELPELVAHLCARITGDAAPELSASVSQSIVRDLGTRYAFPGNVRQLEQCVRRVLMTGACARDEQSGAASGEEGLVAAMREGKLAAEALLEQYCALLYARNPNYVEVARITGLDRRTVKKHVDRAAKNR